MLNLHWSLDELYPSFESDAFQKDMESCNEQLQQFKEWAEQNLQNSDNPVEKIAEFIRLQNQFYDRYTRLYNFAELSLSVQAKNVQALQYAEKLEEKATELVLPAVQFSKWLGELESFESLIVDERLVAHRYYLEEMKKQNEYLLSDDEEVLVAKMKNTGSNAWSKLQELLTSTLLVEIEEDGEKKQLPLSVVRNLAYDPDPAVRKKAYEAELAAYPKMEDSSAACLNGIKGEVITLSKRRGYASPLEKTLIGSRMDGETLDAMLTAMKESLPTWRRFYRRKAELLGYQGKGLPFYELFAPMGKTEISYTYEQAHDFIVKHFRSFSDKLADFADNAFKNRWIDAEPREGKRGGAFCANLHSIKESRILSNFSGSFSDVVTLAHELGHGYHGDCLKDESYLNSNYPMPIAETASIFCETIIKQAALKEASREEAFAILESELSDSGQVIVDIYSRFLFESELFRRREEASLSVEELKNIMLESQKKAYGDGLDPNYLHPYMWVCKPHYYYAEENYYNFPYAFGLLFSKGLYAEYLKRGDAFVKEYDQLLAVTGKQDIWDVAQIMGVDVHSVDFWRSSLKLIEKDIEYFITL